MIHQIVDRCHVGMTDRAVIRAVIGRLKAGYATWAGLPREDRRTAMRQAIARHRANQAIARQLGGGR